MKSVAWYLTLSLLVALAAGGNSPAAGPAISPQEPSAEESPAAPPADVPVYVTNFQLDVLPDSQALRAAARANPSEPPPDPAKLAGQVVDLMAMKIVAALRKQGYSAQRFRPGDERPSNGLQIRGIFTEVDEQNHWRRAVIRTASDTGKMEAMVAVANLARPDQALYEIAPLPGNENKPGAVITLSPYVPMQKYDVDKNAGEDIFSRAASSIASDLTALLQKNPAAM